MKINQRGFSLVEVLLIILVVSAMSFGGWYIWNENNSGQSNTQDTQTNQEDESDIPDGWVEYVNEEIGFKFYHPSSWGEVSVTEEDNEDTKGRDFRLTFSDKDEVRATIRSTDWEIMLGRGGAYYDSPTEWSSIDPSNYADKDWDGNHALRLVSADDEMLIYYECSDFLSTAQIDALINLDGEKYEVAKFYYLVDEPSNEGLNEEGCENIESYFEGSLEEFVPFVETIRPLED